MEPVPESNSPKFYVKKLCLLIYIFERKDTFLVHPALKYATLIFSGVPLLTFMHLAFSKSN